MQGFAGFTEPGVGQGVLFVVTWYPVSGWLTGSPMSSFPFYRRGNRLRETRGFAQQSRNNENLSAVLWGRHSDYDAVGRTWTGLESQFSH